MNLRFSSVFCDKVFDSSVMDGEGVSNDSFGKRRSAACRHPIRLAHFGNRSQAIGFAVELAAVIWLQFPEVLSKTWSDGNFKLQLPACRVGTHMRKILVCKISFNAT